MAIKTSTASEKNQKIQRVQQEIKQLLQHKILNEVPEIKKSIEELLVKVNGVTFKNTNPQMLKGKIPTVEEILSMIKESSGYTKWKFSNTETLETEEINDIKETYNIDFKEKEINRHVFSRSTNDRDALSTILVTVLPGLFQVDLHTNRVGYELEGLVNKEQFEQGIAVESDN